MDSRNIDEIIDKVRKTLDTHRIDEGRYSRWIWQNEKNNRNLGINEYGCADAANILYTIGDFPELPESREQWVKTLQNMQNQETGMFFEGTHHSLHTTAHCLAALELFDAKALFPVKEAEQKYGSEDGLECLLDNLDWRNKPWSESHQGAGIFAVRNITGTASQVWNDAYFKWFLEESDEKTGLFGKSFIGDRTVKLFEYMAGTFHYLFNHEYAHMPIRYPEKLIDTCLRLYDNVEQGELGNDFFNKSAFIQVDWVYCITRALRQCGYRYADCIKALEDFAQKYLDYLFDIDETKDDDFNDLHLLFGSVCCLAELQQTLRGKLITRKPLKLVLDRRPFI